MTIKQRKFIRALIRTGEPTEAAMQVYNCKNRLSAKSIANQLLTKLDITMTDLMNKMGIDTEADIALLDKLRKAKITKHFAHEGNIVDEAEYDDNATQLKALDLTLKLKGRINGDKTKVENHTYYTRINIENLERTSEEDLIALTLGRLPLSQSQKT